MICLATEARWSEAERLQPGAIRNGVFTFSRTKSEGSVGPNLAGAGKEDNEALEALRAFHPGDNLVPACAGKNHDQATERAGRSCTAAHLRQPLHPERRKHPHAAKDTGPFELGHDDAVRACGAGSLLDAVKLGPLRSFGE